MLGIKKTGTKNFQPQERLDTAYITNLASCKRKVRFPLVSSHGQK
jgi:hypothetical protein